MGDAEDWRAAQCARRNFGRNHSRPRPSSRRNHGRDHGYWQHAANREIIVRAGLHAGQRDRQRILRGHRQSLPERIDRDRSRSVHRDHGCERAGSRAGLERNARHAGKGAGIVMRGSDISLRRRITNGAALTAMALAAILVVTPLVAIFGYLLYRGVGALNWSFLTQLPKPVGEPGGGMANAIVGSGLILLVASAIGVPLGIGAGVFLAEYGRNRWGNLVRFTADVLNGVPSIVIGITVYGVIVLRQKHFSSFAGGVALAIMMIPTISRSTEEMLLMVPEAVREAALGLGIPQWRTTVSVVL